MNSKFNRAKNAAQAYTSSPFPTMIVDGKYLTASDRVGTHAAMPPVLDALIAKARAERAKT